MELPNFEIWSLFLIEMLSTIAWVVFVVVSLIEELENFKSPAFERFEKTKETAAKIYAAAIWGMMCLGFVRFVF
jgi:hypothetical protein